MLNCPICLLSAVITQVPTVENENSHPILGKVASKISQRNRDIQYSQLIGIISQSSNHLCTQPIKVTLNLKVFSAQNTKWKSWYMFLEKSIRISGHPHYDVMKIIFQIWNVNCMIVPRKRSIQYLYGNNNKLSLSIQNRSGIQFLQGNFYTFYSEQ